MLIFKRWIKENVVGYYLYKYLIYLEECFGICFLPQKMFPSIRMCFDEWGNMLCDLDFSEEGIINLWECFAKFHLLGIHFEQLWSS